MKLIRIVFAFIIYLLILSILMFLKPNFLFNEKGEIRETGFRIDNKSIISLYIMIPIIIIIIYIILIKFGDK
jgi:hypothetical protein